MGLLDDDYVPRYKPPKSRRYKPKDNFEELQNHDTKEVTEDFSDQETPQERKDKS